MDERITAVIGTTGPFSLLCGAAHLHQLGVTTGSTAVFQFSHTTPTLTQCTEWMTAALGLTWLGHIGPDLQPAYRELTGCTRARRAVGWIGFPRRWRRWGRQHLAPADPRLARYAVLSFRTKLEDVLVANLFPNAERHYVADGLLMGLIREIRMPAHWRLAGLEHPFAPGRPPVVWAPETLRHALDRVADAHPIPGPDLDWASQRVRAAPEFGDWVSRQLADVGDCTVVLLQDLADAWLDGDADREIALYREIVRRELAQTEGTVVVKPHPRDRSDKLSALREAVRPLGRVRILEPDRLSALPVELLLRPARVRAVVGLSSTALVTAPQWAPVDVRSYTDASLPGPLRAEIARCATAAGLEPIECHLSETESCG